MSHIPYSGPFIQFGFSVILIGLAPIAARADHPPINRETCSYNGIPLNGRVQIVDSFPDIRVQTVSSFPDLQVEVVSSFPDDCGQWQFTNSFPDFTIQFVESFPDIQIQFVESFPGIP